MITLCQAVWKCVLPDAATKIVLLELADHANTEALAWPSLATIASETSLCLTAVKKRIAWLDREGFIKRHSSRDRVTSNRYHLSLEKINAARASDDPPASSEGRAPHAQGSVATRPTVGREATMGGASDDHEPSLNRQRTPTEPNEKQTTPEGARNAGYPLSEAEARSMAGTAGVSPDYAAILWHECEGVGGKDFNGHPVTNFTSFAKSCWARKQENDRRRRRPSPPSESKPTPTCQKPVPKLDNWGQAPIKSRNL